MDKLPTNSLSSVAPWLSAEFHPTKNVLPFSFYSAGSERLAWWICSKGHEWESVVKNRAKAKNPTGCPYCSGRLVTDKNSLSVLFPQFRGEYSPKNSTPLESLTVSSGRKVWWMCRLGHEWQSRVASRTLGQGCPYCSHNRVSDLNSLSSKNPRLAIQWDSAKNKLSPSQVAFASNKKVWWICDQGHSWSDSIDHRSLMGLGCPFCTGKRVTDNNSLSVLFPNLRSEFHPTKNTRSFESLSIGMDIEVWWICRYGHEWETSPKTRARGCNCPSCTKQHSKAELDIYELVLERYPDTINGARRLLRSTRLELDIYVPSLRKAIEYDGTYWHSLPDKVGADLHKNEQCIEVGIQLLRIPEAEYEADRDGTIKKILEWLQTP